MDLGLKGRVALVAASSKGLGRAVAWGLAQEGACLSLCARGEEELQKTAWEIREATGAEVLATPTDVTRQEQVERLVRETLSRFGRVDILVNNAGGPPLGTFIDLPPEAFQQALNLNLLSTLYLCKGVVPSMKERRWGRIITIASFAVKQPVPGLILSSMARSGVVGLAKAMAGELAPYNILVNTVLPGFMLTERAREVLHGEAREKGIPPEEYLRHKAREIPLGRYGDPRELADLIVFLASERASYITGATIQVDGGLVRALL